VARLSQDTSNLAPWLIGRAETHQLRRVQSVNTTSDRPSTQEREVGNESIVGVTFDRPNVTVALEANLVNARLVAIMANRDPDNTFSNLLMQDLLGQTDLDLNLVQRNTARSEWLRSIYVKQASLTSYSLSASVDASSTETFEFNSDNKTAFERWLQVDHVAAGSDGDTSYTLSETPVPLTRGKEAGNVLKSVFLSSANEPNIYLLEGADNDYTVSGTTVTLTATGAANVLSGDLVTFVYQIATPPAGDPFLAKDTVSPAAIRGYYHVPVTLRVGGTNLPIRGAQSVEATMNFNSNVEVGMGSQALGSERVIPAEVTGSFTIFEEGMDVEKFLIAGETDSADTDYPIEAYRSDVILELDFKHPDTGTILRTDTLSGISISGDTKDVAVGTAVGKQFNFTAATDFGWYVDKLV
jgi:hypothetical protein